MSSGLEQKFNNNPSSLKNFLLDNDPIITDAASRLTSDEVIIALRHRVLLIGWPSHTKKCIVANHPAAIEFAHHHGLEIVAYCSGKAMLKALQLVYQDSILKNASFWLQQNRPVYSAAQRLSNGQVVAGGVALAAIAIPIFPQQLNIVWLLLSTVLFMIFVGILALRLANILRFRPVKLLQHRKIKTTELPVYTVLVPLYRETEVLQQLMSALVKLDYPANKLDIKLILEADDRATRKAVAELDLPPQFEAIIVPVGSPRTKPKALNYALNFARGELVTIFDAEDIPEPQQLKLAAEFFAGSDPQIVCLQARLSYYNANENWLTRQFTIEYAALFDLLLPMLASLNLPLPLGGTSNHFRSEALRQLGGWDPHNVTEDADIGLRLARRNWRAAMLPVSTFEEANCQLGNWMQQRSRWLKGWLQTWLVHSRNPALLLREVGFFGFVISNLLMVGILISALFHPILVGYTLLWFMREGVIPHIPSLANNVVAAAALVLLLAGYVVNMAAGFVALGRRGLWRLQLSVLTMPLYWLLISAAAWLALWQFITTPYQWNKTRHGLTKLRKKK